MMGTVPDFERAGLPTSLRLMRINTYLYLAMAPKAAPPEVVMKGMGLLNRTAPGVFKLMMGKMVGGMSKKTEAFLNPIVEQIKSYWLDEILPEVKQHLAYFESGDLRSMSLDQLRAHLAETLKRVERIGGLHGVIIPAPLPWTSSRRCIASCSRAPARWMRCKLTQGFDNKILVGDRALWRLSRAPLWQCPRCTQFLSGHAAVDVIPALEESRCEPAVPGRPARLAQSIWSASQFSLCAG